jgi:hypothetical protein
MRLAAEWIGRDRMPIDVAAHRLGYGAGGLQPILQADQWPTAWIGSVCAKVRATLRRRRRCQNKVISDL